MADLSVPDVFAPDDRVALFCVSMAMAANDIEYALRQAVLANPDGACDEERERLRFSQKVRLTYGFLFEGIHALKVWRQQEAVVATLLRELPQDGAKLLKKVCGLEQQIGTETIAHVRHNTFHYPHPEPSKAGRLSTPFRSPIRSRFGWRFSATTTRMLRPWLRTAPSRSSTWSGTFTSASASSAASVSSLFVRDQTTSRS